MITDSFRKGIFDGLPICFGYLSVAFAFGIFAVASGLTVPDTILISMLNVTSAGQIAAVPIIVGGGTLIELGVSQLMINLRYSLMSITLSQHMHSDMNTPRRALFAFVNTDEVFAVASAQPGKLGRHYLYGLILMPYLGWSCGTAAGALIGTALPTFITNALALSMYGMLIALVVPDARSNKSVILCVLLAALIGCIIWFVPALSVIPDGFRIIISAVIASAVIAYFFPIPVTQTEKEGA